MPASTVPVSPFRGYRFPPEIITHAVWLYHRVPAGDRSFRPVAPINLSMPYGERYRNGETISSAFVESTVNQVVSKRMVKKQQMRWAPKSAHLLLQVRTKVLNDELAEVFQRWYPAFDAPAESPMTEDLAA